MGCLKQTYGEETQELKVVHNAFKIRGKSDVVGYRYGFNGKEKDGEWNDNYNYDSRIYDPRIGRWYSVDPSYMKNAHESTYMFTGNNPVFFKDDDGKDYIVVTDHEAKTMTIRFTIYASTFYNRRTTQSTNYTTLRAQATKTFYEKMHATYTVKGNNGEDIHYNVKFEVGIQTFEKPKPGEETWEDRINNDPGGNSFSVVDQEKLGRPKFTPDGKRLYKLGCLNLIQPKLQKLPNKIE